MSELKTTENLEDRCKNCIPLLKSGPCDDNCPKILKRETHETMKTLKDLKYYHKNEIAGRRDEHYLRLSDVETLLTDRIKENLLNVCREKITNKPFYCDENCYGVIMGTCSIKIKFDELQQILGGGE